MGNTTPAGHGIAVVGFPYVREEYFAVFRHWPEPDRIRFLLPARWSIKGGKTTYTAPQDPRVSSARAYFSDYRWKYPVIGGLLKGIIPSFPLWLWRNRRRCDVVYACSEPMLLTTLYYALSTRLMGKKLVLFSWENIDYAEKFRGVSKYIHSALITLNLKLAHGLMCGNSQGAAIFRKYGSMPIAVIPMNGLDPELFSRDAVSRANYQLPIADISPDRIVFTFIGALGYRKGVHLILQAMPEVIAKLPNAHLVIAGSGEYETELERLMHEPFLEGRVTRFQWLSHEEVRRLMAITDVFVYPSMPHKGWAEQFGYAMAEASLMELPVISTRSGSIPDVVRNGETGILVPPGDVGALAEAMVRLGSDEALRHRMGATGRVYIAEHFSHESVAHRMHEFIMQRL